MYIVIYSGGIVTKSKVAKAAKVNLYINTLTHKVIQNSLALYIIAIIDS